MRFFERRRPVSSPSRAETVRLVVVEEGAPGFGSVVLPDGGDETVVVAQAKDENAVTLALRVVERIASIEHSQRLLEKVVVVVGSRTDSVASRARSSITKALLSQMTGQGMGELLLAADGAAPPVRHELLGLVETLVEAFGHAAVPIRLRFRPEVPPPRASGIYPAATTPPSARSTMS